MSAEQIGTVEILNSPDGFRVYTLDPSSDVCDVTAQTVCVPNGVYPLYRDGISYFWMMTGNLNAGRMQRLGDGLFSMTPGDDPSGVEVTFPSRRFGPDEWVDLLDSDTCRESHPGQRLRVTIDAGE